MNTEEKIEHLLVTIEGAASLMRGITLDPQVPNDAKIALRLKIEELESTVEEYTV